MNASNSFYILETVYELWVSKTHFIWIDCQDRVKKAQKQAAEANLQAAISTAIEFIDKLNLRNEASCVLRIDVGLDTNAVREALLKVMEKQKVDI
jgi:alanyl-tRNA synthetase